MKNWFFVLILFICYSLSATEVGGLITQNTTWTLAGSPYYVTNDVIINANATLTIEPGVVVKLKSADMRVYENFYLYNGGPIAKSILVYGKIIAKGTAENPIIFDRDVGDNNYRWGTIRMMPYAPVSTFEYCQISHSLGSEHDATGMNIGALIFENGDLKLKYCTFLDNLTSLVTFSLSNDIVIYGCTFLRSDIEYTGSYNTININGISGGLNDPGAPYHTVVFAKNRFEGFANFRNRNRFLHQIMINNEFINVGGGSNFFENIDSGNISFYGNSFINGNWGLMVISGLEADTSYFRKNFVINNSNSTNLAFNLFGVGNGRNDISDNNFYGKIYFNPSLQGVMNRNCHFHNNKVITTQGIPIHDDGMFDPDSVFTFYYNNLFIHNLNMPSYGTLLRTLYIDYITRPFFFNNLALNYSNVLEGGNNYGTYKNNIIQRYNRIINTSDYCEYTPENYPGFSFNYLALQFPQSIFYFDDGFNLYGNNPCFNDEENMEFSLTENSPCINSGENIPELPDYDYAYNKRITTGFENGEYRVDIGPYEYNSYYIGGLKVYVMDEETGLPVDCVKAMISGKLPEYTDSLGFFTAHTGAGSFNLEFSRWDYDTQSISNVQVNEGETTTLYIYLNREGSPTDEENTPVSKPELKISNFPNPFNPSTTVRFELQENGLTDVSVYNIKGQKIRNLSHANYNKGVYNLFWNGKSDTGRIIASGVYFIKISQNGKQAMKKALMVK